MFTCLKKGAFH